MKKQHKGYPMYLVIMRVMISCIFFMTLTTLMAAKAVAVDDLSGNKTFELVAKPTLKSPEPPAGPSGKWRLLVDKVLMKHNNWIMTENHIKEIKEAGFNIVSPRKGGTNPNRVKRIALLSQKHNLFYVAWMRGSRNTENGIKYTHADGTEQSIYSPNADEFWDWLSSIILEHAEISVQVPAMIGSFIDFENYAPQKSRSGNCYQLSYDRKILEEFTTANNIELPELVPAARAPWINKNGLAEAFSHFQVNSWRAKARELRKRIDAINPNYFLIIYPAPGTVFMQEALYPEWATRETPLVLADSSTYGRPKKGMPEKIALETNKNKLATRFYAAAERNIPFLYIGGIDPLSRDADPEFSGKNASMIADTTDGYWVFYEGPEYRGEHSQYFKWFKKANDDITSRAYKLPALPRSEPE